MKFAVRFKIGGRLGAGSAYSLKEFCVYVVDRYALTETEVCTIVTLQPGERFANEDMEVVRQPESAREVAARQLREAKDK